jgi:protein-tyrosine phosphatase
MLLLALVGVATEEIAADHALSTHRLSPLYARLGEEDQGTVIEELLGREDMSVRKVIVSTLRSLDAEACLRRGGLNDDDLAAVRARLLGPARSPMEIRTATQEATQ